MDIRFGLGFGKGAKLSALMGMGFSDPNKLVFSYRVAGIPGEWHKSEEAA